LDFWSDKVDRTDRLSHFLQNFYCISAFYVDQATPEIYPGYLNYTKSLQVRYHCT